MNTEGYPDNDTNDSGRGHDFFVPQSAPPVHQNTNPENRNIPWKGIVGGTVLGIGLAASGYSLFTAGQNSGNETANNGEAVVPPPENVATAPVTPGQNKNTPPTAEQPLVADEIDIPREAREWVEEYGHLYAAEDMLPAYYTDKAHHERFGYSAIIPQANIDNYEPSTRPDQGQLPGIRAQTLPLELDHTQAVDMTDPEIVVGILNGGVPSAIENYLNHKAINPSTEARQIIEDEFAILIGNPIEREPVQRLMNDLDNILVTHGNNAVYQVRNFETTPTDKSHFTDADPSFVQIDDYYGDAMLYHGQATKFDADNNPVAVDAVVNPAIDITSFDEEGNEHSVVHRQQLLLSFDRHFTTPTIHIGTGDSIGNYQ